MPKRAPIEDPQLGIRLFDATIGSNPSNVEGPNAETVDDWDMMLAAVESGEADTKLAGEHQGDAYARIRALANLPSPEHIMEDDYRPVHRGAEVGSLSLGQVITTEEGHTGVIVAKDNQTGRVTVRKDDTGEELEFEAERLQVSPTAMASVEGPSEVEEPDNDIEWFL